MNELTADYVRKLLNYDKDTGIFTWNVRPRGNRVHKDNTAGCISNQRNMVLIGIEGKIYLAHRLAWLWVHGEWPKNHIDHIDGNPNNNSIANLRDVSRSVNQQNRKGPAKHNKSGLMGAYKRYGHWKADIRVNGKTIYLGAFETKEEAHEAFIQAKRKLHPGCTI